MHFAGPREFASSAPRRTIRRPFDRAIALSVARAHVKLDKAPNNFLTFNHRIPIVVGFSNSCRFPQLMQFFFLFLELLIIQKARKLEIFGGDPDFRSVSEDKTADDYFSQQRYLDD